jgi:hypothetical protein
MQRPPQGFTRVREGEWFCTAPATFNTPAGVVTTTPGVTYRKGRTISGLDVADALDSWHATGKLPPNVSFSSGPVPG